MVEKVCEGLSGEEMERLLAFQPKNEFVSRALGWAIIAHRGQKRRSGEPYIEHPIAVANILSREWGLNQNEIQAEALLHDTIEDSPTSFDEIKQRWGERVAMRVRDVTKFDSDLKTMKEVSSRSYINVESGVQKLADRLHNMRTLDVMPPEKQIKIALETDMVYRELAESLGIWIAKEELSDLAFKYLYPEEYIQISEEMKKDPRTEPECYLHYKSKITALFAERGPECDVSVRFKGKYSTYLKREKKVFANECSPDDLTGIDDLVSIGIIVKTRQECYLALDKMHNEWDGKIIPDKLKDRISQPADNGFQALQTAILTPAGPVEIAIMTEDMKAFNDLGFASMLSRDGSPRKSLLKPVFLPSGRALFMPPGSTGVDLMCHQDPQQVGKNPKLIIDGTEMPLTTVIPVGATAEIVTLEDSKSRINSSWFDYCSGISEKKLREMQLAAREEELKEKGRITMRELLMPRGLLFLEDAGTGILNKVIRGLDRKENRVKSPDQLYHLIGGGYLNPEKVTAVLNECGVSKQDLGLSTVRVTGKKDQPGILEKLTAQINAGGGNIKSVFTETENGFQVRIIVRGLNPYSEISLKELLAGNPLFDEVVVI